MEYNLNYFENRGQPQFLKIEDNLNFFMEDNPNMEQDLHFSIKWKTTPFFWKLNTTYIFLLMTSINIVNVRWHKKENAI